MYNSAMQLSRTIIILSIVILNLLDMYQTLI